MTITTFIGAGNIAQALMGGYLATLQNQGPNSADRIIASDPIQKQLDRLPALIERQQDNLAAILDSDVVVLCVKPNVMEEICRPLMNHCNNKLFISVAAGITATSLSTWLGQDTAIIRCMPNTPALVQQGMTGLYANVNVSPEQCNHAERILGSVGDFQWFDEEAALDAVTAISGSGPAYYFLVMEAMQQAGISLGLSPQVSRKLVLQTALGAAQMAISSDLSTEQLRLNVTSPGGTTQAALGKLLECGVPDAFSAAITAAYERSKELSTEVTGDG